MIHLVRHGETDWSRTRRHTGSTEVALTAHGRRQASALAPMLNTIDAATVLCSPRRRSLETAEVAGYGRRLVVDDRLAEWNYGEAEGLTTAEVRETVPDWSVWTHALPGGETLHEVGCRADAVISDLCVADGVDTIVFAHAHLLRILAARWCRLPPGAGQHLVLDPASISVLGHERSTPCIVRWNVAH